MTDIEGEIIGGVDAHTDTHVAAALDRRWRLVGTQSFADAGWLSGAAVMAAGVRGARRCRIDRRLCRQARPRAARRWNPSRRDQPPSCRTRRRRGKNEPIDAEMAARQALARTDHVVPKQTNGIVEAIRQLRLARDSAVKARSAAPASCQR